MEREADIKMAKVIRHISGFSKGLLLRDVRHVIWCTEKLPPTVQFPGLIAWVTMRK